MATFKIKCTNNSQLNNRIILRVRENEGKVCLTQHGNMLEIECQRKVKRKLKKTIKQMVKESLA